MEEVVDGGHLVLVKAAQLTEGTRDVSEENSNSVNN